MNKYGVVKKCTKPKELVLYELLSRRKILSVSDKRKYWNLKQGYEGEVMFDQRIQNVAEKHFAFGDLLLEKDGRIFQLDTLLLLNNTLYLFEVKNYIGEFSFQNDKFYNEKGIEIENPLIQLYRSTSLLRQILEAHRFHIPLKSYVVFINPECTIYLSSRINELILPTQINRFISSIPANQHVHPSSNKIIEIFLSLHQETHPYQQLPSYNYEELNKGLICIKCAKISTTIEGYYCVCKVCHHRELLDNAILRSIKELQFVFPDFLLTNRLIKDWCDGPSRKRIHRILNKNYMKKGEKKGTFYE